MYKNTYRYLVFVILFAIYSCKGEQEYFLQKEGKKIFYDVFFQDKENKKNNYKQSYYFLPREGDTIPVLKNDGEIVFYAQEKEGIFKKNVNQFILSKLEKEKTNYNLLIAFPISKNLEWESNDKTTLQMKVGYDRVFNTDLPFKLKNKIVETNETIKIKGKKIKNCIKIESYGKTSYNPGPPLGNINIEIFSTSWFAKGLGLVRYQREENSDSETMGKIIYEKTMLIDD